MKFIINLIIAIWTTSTLFMLFFWANALIQTYLRDRKIFLLPLPYFLLIHFCPIIHTIKCFEILRRYAIIKNIRKEKREV